MQADKQGKNKDRVKQIAQYPCLPPEKVFLSLDEEDQRKSQVLNLHGYAKVLQKHLARARRVLIRIICTHCTHRVIELGALRSLYEEEL